MIKAWMLWEDLLPLFVAAMTVHSTTMALITPTNIFMGLYVHPGNEMLRWWHKS